MKIQVQISLEHGILFLYDPYHDPEIPPDTGAAPITSTDSCICFQVAAYVEGEADVTLSDQPLSGTDSTFSGKIQVPSGHIALTDVPGNYYCILRIKAEYAEVLIWNYEENGAEISWIQVKDIDLF